jgi:hypothetical protein
MSRSDRSGRRSRRPRHRPDPSQDFRCAQCRALVSALAPGTAHRNHCPRCLWSRHVDHKPGDRAAGCDARMEPIAIWVRDDEEWALVHRCVACQALKANRIAGDDNEFLLVSLAARPIAMPPFPLLPLARASDEGDG